MQTKVTIPVQSNFSFRAAVYSHGWCMLAPFSVTEEPLSLSYAAVVDSAPVEFTIMENSKGPLSFRIRSANELTRVQHKECRNLVRSMLRTDEEFDSFYRLIQKVPELRWIKKVRAGRMLRSGSFFEDLVKVVCTTNCSWSLTTIMVNNLCMLLGADTPSGRKTFPLPEVIAAKSEAFMRKEIRAGYRSPYILELAALVASGKINVELYRESEKTTDELYRELVTLKGIGPYAAESLLKLIGRYDHLALDSWTRKKYYELYHNGRRVTDKTIAKRYGKYGEWAGLVFWLEMTKYWYEKKFPL
jgi:3-methyladenine DNA glycosylase/8-oxoguanine DNA glycosylase